MAASLATVPGGHVDFGDDRIADLRTRFRGTITGPEDAGYDDARGVENLAIDRRPGLIIRCSGEADVIDGVALAREHGLLLAVRGGGHNVAGHGVADGALQLDLRDMNAVWVDPVHRTVRVQGGSTWGQVDRESQVFGLAVPGGAISTTGAGGLTLGGGIGWLHRRWGLTCDNLISAQVVLASGELVTASEEEHPDLFWAIRGGGGNFGVAVDLTFRAHPIGPEVAAAAVFHDAADGAEVLPRWRDLALEAGDEVTSRAMYWSMPAVDELPPPVQGRDVLIIGALYAGPAAEGREAVEPFRHLGTPLFDMSDHVPSYRSFQSDFDQLVAGMHSYWKSVFLDRLDDEAVAFVHDRAMSRPDPGVLVHVPAMGGATAAVAPEATAFGDRSASFILSFDGGTRDPARFEEVRRWVRGTIEDARRLGAAGGTYLNFSADDPTDAVLADQFGGNLARLRDVKRRYDPQNLFRVNHNITPA